jgi:transcription initiation factor TFIID subunit 12
MAQANNGGGPANAPLIRPSQVDNLPHMTAEQKTHYKGGLTRLWAQMEGNPPGSQQHADAETKIKQASLRIMHQISSGNRPASGGGAQQQQQQQQQQQRVQAQAQAQQSGGQGGMPQGANMAQQGSSQGTQQQLTPAQNQELRNIRVNVPPPIASQGEATQNSYRASWYRKASALITKRDQLRLRGQQVQAEINGKTAGPNAPAEIESLKKELQVVMQEWDGMKKKNISIGAGQAPNMQRQHSGGAVGQQQQNAQQGDVNMQLDTGHAQSPQPLQGGFNQQSQVAPSPVQQQQQQQNAPQQPTSAHPQSATHHQPPQTFQQQQGNVPQQRPQMNAQQLQQAQQNMLQQQQQNAQNIPQSASQPQPPQQQQQQRPQALSHQAAMSQAAENYSRQQQNQQQANQQQNAQMPQVPNGLPLPNPPQSATQQTPTAAYPTLQQQNQNASASNKFPINRTLNLDPRTQQAVQGPPARPTYANAGMMQQPGQQRPAQFTLEGEGDRVLSKRKLDELVRQVTGSTASSSSDSNGLTPEVEESILTLADDFVDNVITSACRLAKLRPNQTLDIRDVQIVLERNYGIRIPGYSLDEVRTVRKFQPAPGWTSKMQAVQAGKVMGGAGGKDT